MTNLDQANKCSSVKKMSVANLLDKIPHKKSQVKVKTCADIYNHWRNSKRLYKKAPKDGIEFQIDYIDTGSSLSGEQLEKAPIVLILHGAPGSYHDFALLIDHLAQQKIRVIAPNFPEYTATVRTKVLFRHSADEKAAYLRDFLHSINVTKIDLLVSHSSAIFPTLLILLNANKTIDNQDSESKLEQNYNENSKENINISTMTSNKQQQQNISDEDDNENKNENEFHNEKFEDASDQTDHNNNDIHQQYTQVKQLIKDNINFEGEHLASQQDSDQSDICNQKQDDEQISKTQARANYIKNQIIREKKTRKKTRAAPAIVKFESTIEIKSVALFNPAGHRLPKSMKPTWFKCGSVHVYQHKIGRYWFRKLGPAFLTIVGVPVKVDNMDNVMLSATVMRNSKCGRVVDQLEQLSKLKIPTLLVFSENDKLIEREIFYEMTQYMGLDQNNFDTFDNEGNIERSKWRPDDWIRVMVFKAGGHYAYSNYAKTVNNAVSELLVRVTPRPMG